MFTSMRFKTPVIDDALSSNIDAMLRDKRKRGVMAVLL